MTQEILDKLMEMFQNPATIEELLNKVELLSGYTPKSIEEWEEYIDEWEAGLFK